MSYSVTSTPKDWITGPVITKRFIDIRAAYEYAKVQKKASPYVILADETNDCSLMEWDFGKATRFALDTDYWDCGCEKDYIIPNGIDKCEVCGGTREECPDAMALEVLLMKARNE